MKVGHWLMSEFQRGSNFQNKEVSRSKSMAFEPQKSPNNSKGETFTQISANSKAATLVCLVLLTNSEIDLKLG